MSVEFIPAEKRWLLAEAIEKYGRNAQLAMLQEECIELAHSLHKHLNRKFSEPKDLYKIEMEIADVVICLEYAYLIFGTTSISAKVKQKLERFEDKILRS